MTTLELKPCPFCGGPANIEDCMGTDFAGCDNDECPHEYILPVEIWNTRPIEDAQQASIKELESRLAALDEQLMAAVNLECSCGGKGPKDPGACSACMVWHRMKGRV